MAQKKESPNGNSKTTLGVGLGAAAAAAAGAYFLYGSKSAAKNRKAVKSWALKAKADVLEKIEDAQEMSQKEYEDLIKSVSGAYAGAKNASKKDLVDFTKEMRDHWKSIEKAAAPLKNKAAKTVKKVEKVAKKVEKVVAPKPAKKAASKKVAKKTAK